MIILRLLSFFKHNMTGKISDYKILNQCLTITPLYLILLCGIKLIDAELLEKTFSTFHASNIVLQQQYRQRQFATYSDLISVLLTTEQTNELLLKNHDLKPVGSKALPEAHANSEKFIGHFKGYKRRQEYNPRRGGRKFNRPRKSNFGTNHNKEKKPKKVTNESICHRCGMTGHWSRTCRTPKRTISDWDMELPVFGGSCRSRCGVCCEASSFLHCSRTTLSSALYCGAPSTQFDAF